MKQDINDILDRLENFKLTVRHIVVEFEATTGMRVLELKVEPTRIVVGAFKMPNLSELHDIHIQVDLPR